ncbi:MAG: hypothetical protein WC565_01740 [Parcubacteria group bacterium]
MTDIIKLGDTVVVYGTLLVNDTPTDPTSLRLEIQDPAGTLTEYVWTVDAEVVRDSVGSFHYNLMVTQNGNWIYRWFSNGALTAFETGTIEVANTVVIQTVSNAVPSVAVPFVTFRIWDGDGAIVDTGFDPQRTDANGSLSIALPDGSYRLSSTKLNWIFDVLYFDISTTPTTVQLIGRPMETRWLQWEDLESIVDVATIDRLFNDKNTAIRDMVLTEQVIQQAETLAESQLLRSWTQQQIVDLAAHDPALRAQAAWLALEAASERRQEFIAADGKGRYWAQYERSMAYFKDLSKSKSQSRGEETAGHGSNAGGSLRPALRPRQARRIFADEPDGSGHGGF